jgi:hypothetical protein
MKGNTNLNFSERKREHEHKNGFEADSNKRKGDLCRYTRAVHKETELLLFLIYCFT